MIDQVVHYFRSGKAVSLFLKVRGDTVNALEIFRGEFIVIDGDFELRLDEGHDVQDSQRVDNSRLNQGIGVRKRPAARRWKICKDELPHGITDLLLAHLIDR